MEVRKIVTNTTKVTSLVVGYVDTVHFEKCSNEENVAFAKGNISWIWSKRHILQNWVLRHCTDHVINF